ncbi:amidohydrolase family protein [Roseisalinus antarcticus]|uniref:8-oxoguanine deaminase n=1 Tax=Roseisalinus antarcticus TaxID=254357 RepID=A0A1Y5RDY4_9RHOB|nr:amidohydrolase family protein [Roseisalinus antarcticus]SLN14828.1 8-oxoguanine deaminase [Roseisalinus antarcticus]
MTQVAATSDGTTVSASWLLPGDGSAPRRAARIALKDGKIGSVSDGSVSDGGESPASGLVLPPVSNAHDHARVARLSQVNSFDVPLEAWLPYLALIPSVDPYLSSAVAFARSAAGGTGSVMAHYTRVQGLTDFPTEAREVARAARDVGINMALAVHCRDINPLVYGDHAGLMADLSPETVECVSRRFLKPYQPVHDQLAMVETVAAEIERDGDGVTVQYGPAGVQWCSDEMLRSIAEASARTGRRVHMHLLETRYQRAWADETYPQGIVTYLDEIGLLTPRLSMAHCIHLRPDEMELIAERGAIIVTNTSSNMIVSSGLAPLGEMLRRGCRIAMGLDGLAFDEDEDALREMRLGYMLNKAHGFERHMDRAALQRMAFGNGRFAITGEDGAGAIRPGAPADMMVLDWEALSAEMIEPEVAPLDLLLARGRKGYVRDLYVGGRTVVRDGRVVGVDLPALEAELLAALRAKTGDTDDLRRAMPELGEGLAKFYTGQWECC